MAQQSMMAGRPWERIVLVTVVLSTCMQLGCKRKGGFEWEGMDGKALAGVNVVHDCLAVHLMDREAGTLDGGTLLRKLIDQCRAEFGNSQDVHFKSDGTIVDVWGRALRIELIDSGTEVGKHRLKVWSLGKNGIDEQGTGDDILSGKVRQ